jgi:flagellar biosynthesis/type III secretory pathway protein FliH
LSDTTVRPKDQRVSPFLDTLFDVPELPRSGSHQSKHLNDLRDSVIKSAQIEGYAIGLEQGHTEGFGIGNAEGFAQALIIAEQERDIMLQAFKAELESIAAEARAAIPAWCELAEQALTERVATICSRIIARELQLDRSTILEIVREGMLEVTHSRTARLRVNPLDAHTVMKYRDELLAATRSLDSLEVLADPAVSGGCVIETDGGTIGASVETQLEVVLGHATEEAA